MIEPTEEMLAAYRAAHADKVADLIAQGGLFNADVPGLAGLAAVLAIVERDYVVYRHMGANPFEPSGGPCGGCGCDKAWHTDVGCTGDFTHCRCVEWVPS